MYEILGMFSIFIENRENRKFLANVPQCNVKTGYEGLSSARTSHVRS